MAEAKSDGVQWVQFRLGQEEYAVMATQVQEIVRSAAITLIPNMPEFVKGICNLRGKIIPLLDLKERFAVHGETDLQQARIIVAHVESQMVGFTVDAVVGVIRIPPDSIEAVPENLPKIDVEYITGVAKISGHLVLLLNMDKILKNIERMILENAEWSKK